MSTPQENSFIEAYRSIIDRELLLPRQFKSIEEAVENFNCWREFYNNRRLHVNLRKKTPAYKWRRYEEQRDHQGTIAEDRHETLTINCERKSPQIEVSRLMDKVVGKPMSTSFKH